ncbi:MAG TPA: PAS domain S-box protein [Planctomycetaceae bacterium]|nr:PAS domain S-box protein [Planctomycetaceae bacterium]
MQFGDNPRPGDRIVPSKRFRQDGAEPAGQRAPFAEGGPADPVALDSQDYLRFALEAAQVGVWEWNIATGEFRLSATVARLHGLAPEDFTGTFDAYLALIHPQDSPHFCERVNAALDSDSGCELEFRAVWPDGSHHWIGGIGRVIFDEHRRPLRMVGLARDVTQRRQTDETIRNLAAVVDSAQDAIVGTTLDGTITSWNDGAVRLYGYLPDEAIGRPIKMLAAPDRLDEVQRLRRKVAQGKRVEQFETVRRRKDGERVHISLNICPIRDEHGIIVGATSNAHDITQRVVLQETLRQSQKMEAVGHLAGGVAHDFNNLLTVIMACSDEMHFARRLEIESLRGLALEIRNAAELAARLTDRILSFSRQPALRAVELDLNNLVEDLRRLLVRLIGDDIELTVDLDPALAPVRGDPGQFEQIILNLVVNAREAMPRGGRITITTRSVEIADADVQFPTDALPGPYALLEVVDNGCGMTPQVRSRIFEQFFTTKGAGKGTGLGLSVVKSIVKECGGHIEVASAVGEGTTVRTYLPVSRANPAADPPGH